MHWLIVLRQGTGSLAEEISSGFLGIEVLRDWTQQLIWLYQSDYIDKISDLATQTERAVPLILMTDKELLPLHEMASPVSINRYQRKVGFILYAAVITQIDIAFAASRLAHFNINPSQEHHEAADCVLRYFRGTKYHALQLGGEGQDIFVVASDASFADNSIDCKSSQAYVIRLFGGTMVASQQAGHGDYLYNRGGVASSCSGF